MSRFLRRFGPLLLAAAALAAGCSGGTASRPNVLFVVWDTTRADRMSVYGFERRTTPFLEEWARGARVFERCTATANSTVPSHGSMFTGLLPGEHGANNLHQYLDESHETLAEIFRGAGYRSYLFAANPHIGEAENFHQGFQVHEHPWSPRFRERALEIVRSKIPADDRSSEITAKVRSGRVGIWDIKACGELAQEGLLDWLGRTDSGRPFFAFLNYMEAHRPFVPAREYRERFMDPAQVERSYQVDRSWDTMWSYTFGLHEYSEADLEVMARTYEACIAELDDLFRRLIVALEAGGYLDNTVVVLVGDHGEHLGEKHLLDHQYSLYEGLVHVPLILWDPGAVAPGRVADPVQNDDLFPTLLELAGLEPPAGWRGRAESLLAPRGDRVRLAEYPSDFAGPISRVKELHPEWDPAPFRRGLTALYLDRKKLIWSSDGRHELYDLARDPEEERNLAGEEPELRARLERRLIAELETMQLYDYERARMPALSREQRERHQALLAEMGYVEGNGDGRSEEGNR